MIGHNSEGRVRCIFRAHGDRGYTKLRNAFLQDSRISDETRGLVARLLSLPDDWEVTVQSIIASGKAGRDKVYRMIKEAEEFGYIKPEERSRQSNGTLGRQVYLVSDDPEALIALAAQELHELEMLYPHTENPEVAEVVAQQQVSPRTAKPDLAEPRLAEPDLVNRMQKKEYKEDINNLDNTTPIVPPSVKPERAKREAVPDQYPHDFEEFWKIYPRREGKAAACKAWQRLKLPQKRRAYVALKAQLPILETRSKDPRGNFCPLPATWINQGRFDDEPEAPIAPVDNAQVHLPIPAWKAEINERNRVIDEALKAMSAKQRAKEQGELAHA